MTLVRKLAIIPALALVAFVGISARPSSAAGSLDTKPTCFSCYCNGDYVGCITSVTYCVNACGETK